jgi:hypothetical protein
MSSCKVKVPVVRYCHRCFVLLVPPQRKYCSEHAREETLNSGRRADHKRRHGSQETEAESEATSRRNFPDGRHRVQLPLRVQRELAAYEAMTALQAGAVPVVMPPGDYSDSSVPTSSTTANPGLPPHLASTVARYTAFSLAQTSRRQDPVPITTSTGIDRGGFGLYSQLRTPPVVRPGRLMCRPASPLASHSTMALSLPGPLQVYERSLAPPPNLVHVLNSVVTTVMDNLETSRVHGLADNLQRLRAGLSIIVLELSARINDDRRTKTVDKVKAAFGDLGDLFALRAVNARGAHGGCPTPRSVDAANRASVPGALDQRLKDLRLRAATLGGVPVNERPTLTGSGLLPDDVWTMTAELLLAQVKAYGLSDEGVKSFLCTESPSYLNPDLAGTTGCAATHFWTSCIVASLGWGPTLVLENDALLTPGQGKAIYDTLLALAQPCLRHILWDLLLIHQGGESPCGPRDEATEVPVLPSVGRVSSVAWAGIVAGSSGYVVSPSGAAKIANSGFHKSLFCKDDFWNCCNANARHDHFNPKLMQLPCVLNVKAKGGLHILYYTKNLNSLDKTSWVSDTRYSLID